MARRLVFLHSPDPLYSAYQNFGNRYTPTWAFTLAAYVPEGWETSLHDTRIQPAEEAPRADVYLYSGLNQDLAALKDALQAVRRVHPGAVHVLGGPICWSFEQAGDLVQLEVFDHVCVGDGEEVLPDLLADLARGERPARIIRAPRRYPLDQARPMHAGLLARHARDYYGALVEVSRGCPFLCEFCDIRIQPDNNRSHVRAPDAVVADVDLLCRHGVRSFMFACDNFIGDQQWAHAMVDALIAWREKTGFRPSIFTWLTINLYKDPDLMAKMRRAGFDVLFIGVESFDQNSLLETAKVQNGTLEDLPEILRQIQAWGFIVTPGLIFGFDSDGPTVFDITVEGLLASCLLTANAGLLTALPGTPLHRRMKLAGRLRDVVAHIGRFKFQTNVRYVQPRALMVDGYIDFVRRVSDPAHQFARLRAYLENLERGGRYMPLEGEGYGNLGDYLRGLVKNPAGLRSFAERLSAFARRPRNVAWALRALLHCARKERRFPGTMRVFQLWMYGWTNFLMQNAGISPADFDLEFVEGPLRRETILPDGYDAEDVGEQIPPQKTRAQLRATVRQLESLLATRLPVVSA